MRSGLPEFAADEKFETLHFRQDLAAQAIGKFLRILKRGSLLELMEQILHLTRELRIIAKLLAQEIQIALCVARHLVRNPAIVRVAGTAEIGVAVAIVGWLAALL